MDSRKLALSLMCMAIIIMSSLVYADTILIKKRINERVDLEIGPDGDARSSGHVKFSTIANGVRSRTRIKVYTDDLPVLNYYEVYEVWLTDDDTGFVQSLGIIDKRNYHRGNLRYSVNNYVNNFDSIKVTVEPFPDTDPRPTSQVVFKADLPW